MSISFRKSFTLLAAAFMFGLVLTSCSKEELRMDSAGGGVGRDIPEATKALMNDADILESNTLPDM